MCGIGRGYNWSSIIKSLEMKHTKLRHFSILYLLILTTLLVIPLGDTHIEQVEVVGFRGDYIIHCLVYIPWMLLGRVLFSAKYDILKWFVIGVVFVAVMELVQYLIPYRGYNTFDLIAGEIGVVISLLILLLFNKFTRV